MHGLFPGGSKVLLNGKGIFLALFFLLVIGQSLSLFAQHDQQDSVQIHPKPRQSTPYPGPNSQWYAGAKVGLVYLFGLEMQYNLATHGVRRMYLAAALQSSLVVNSANIGGGVYLGNTGLGLGCRYHHILWFETEGEGKIQPGYGPEIIWNKSIGTRYLVNLHAGCVVSDGTYFPDISFGLLIPLR